MTSHQLPVLLPEYNLRDNIDCEALQRDLDDVVLWAQKWQMHVGRQIGGCEYYMGGSKVEEETLEKDLGVWIFADKKCSQQCRYAVNKASKVTGMIKRTIT